MSYLIKKFIFIFLFNTSLLTMLILGIQNSSNKSKVNFILDETIHLPVSFIVGISFITGSILGSCMKINDVFQKKTKNLE